ncbi:MAG: nucleotidyltransferase family protein [Planctomycetota bacterium]|nr:nucleotidyltransferase family protein [Planctomycetota bacterium]
MKIALADILGPAPDPLRLATLDAMACTAREERLKRIRERVGERAPEWLAFGERNRVGPLVAHAILDALGPNDPARDDARRIHDAEAERMRVMMGELDAVAARLAKDGIKVVALKNAGIARGLFPCAACCPMGDVDLLVDPVRFKEAHAGVLDCGFKLDTRAEFIGSELEAGIKHGGTEYLKQRGPHTVWFELQWRPVAGRWIRPEQEPKAADLLARAVPVAGSAVHLLAPADNLLQVCLHTTKHSYARAPGLRLHTDVDRLAHYAPPDWDAFVAAAGSLTVKTACYFALALAEALLRSEIPDRVLAALAPDPGKTAAVVSTLRRADVFEPDGRKFSRLGMLRFHARLYDDAAGFWASVFDTDRGRLGLRHLPSNLWRGARRAADVLFRFQS